MRDFYTLENIEHENEIWAEFFVPLTILRLTKGLDEQTKEIDCLVTLINIKKPGRRKKILHLRWESQAANIDSIPVQPNTVTELAACGMACVFAPLYAKLSVLSVAQVGDQFDYWIGNERQRWALEVSGTISDNIEIRHRIKVNQLLNNPYSTSGFVIVTRFETRESIFSFNRQRGKETMEETYTDGIYQTPPSERFRELEREKSKAILLANWLKQQHRYVDATEEFANAAEIETILSEELKNNGQMEAFFIHRFSAASCWVQSGNLYLAKTMLKEMLRMENIPEKLSRKIENYLSELEYRTENWLKTFAMPFAAA